jgi:hypothetical protein
MIALLFALSYSGLAGLCLAMPVHARKLLGTPPRRLWAAALRFLGGALLLESLMGCTSSWGWAMGCIAWFGIASVAGLTLVGLLALNARTAALLALAGPVIAIILR